MSDILSVNPTNNRNHILMTIDVSSCCCCFEDLSTAQASTGVGWTGLVNRPSQTHIGSVLFLHRIRSPDVEPPTEQEKKIDPTLLVSPVNQQLRNGRIILSLLLLPNADHYSLDSSTGIVKSIFELLVMEADSRLLIV